MTDNGAHFAGCKFLTGWASLLAFHRIAQCLLVGAFGNRHALHTHQKARVVHHREHAGKAPVLLPDQIANGPALFAISHGAGWAAVNAELVLKANALGIIAVAQRAVFVHQEFWHHEKRDAARARRCIGKPGQHQMDNIVRHVVVAIGDENFGARDEIGSVILRHCLGLQSVEVGTRLRLCQVHGAGPLTRDEFWQIGLTLCVGAMNTYGFNDTLGEDRAKTKRQTGSVPHLLQYG